MAAFIKAEIEDYSKISVEDGYITLDYAYPYCIDQRRTNTPAKILGWAEHLSHKNWMTKDRLIYFLEVAFKQIGIESDRCL